VGERNCSISNILRSQNNKENAPMEKDINELMELFPEKAWDLKSDNIK
jgi:hypothetical protein